MKDLVITKDDIYRLLAERRIPSQAWLASQIGMSPQAFNKVLMHGKGFNDEQQKALNIVFRKEGVIVDDNEQCGLLIKQTMHASSIINQSLSSLNEVTLSLAGDNDLPFDEIKKLIDHYELMLEEFQQQVYSLIKIVKGRK